MSYKAVFLDRDGTINYDPGYLGDPDQVKILPGVAEGIHNLKSRLDFKIIVISNQSGVDRGLITHDQVKLVNEKINELLMEQNTQIDVFYYCPYHPDFSGVEKAKSRKPSPKMIFAAAEENEIDLNSSFMIGDKAIDVLAGKNSNLKTILLKTNSFTDEINSLKKEGKSPNFVAENFLDAVEFIKQDFN